MKIGTINYPICKVVGDAAMSHPGIGEARLIPAVVIDALDNRSIPELLVFHQTTPPGDTKLRWATYPFGRKNLILNLEFSKPMEVSFGIEFDVNRDLTIIDGIIQSRALCLQCGVRGDKFMLSDAPNILIEVPNLDFDKKWESMLVDTLKKKYRKRNYSKKEAAAATKEHIRSMRELFHMRRSD